MLKTLIPPENLLSQLPGAFLWKDLNLRYCAANLNIAKNFGFKTVGHMVGLNSYDIQCPAVEYADQFLKNDQECIDTKKNIQTVDVHEFSDQKKKLFIGERVPLFNEEGRVVGLLYQATEVSKKGFMEIGVALCNSNKKFKEKKPINDGGRFIVREKTSLLTSRELEVLFYMIRNKTAKEIANLLNISFRTVESYFHSIKSKMHYISKSDVIEKSVVEGLINIIPSTIFLNKFSINLGSSEL